MVVKDGFYLEARYFSGVATKNIEETKADAEKAKRQAGETLTCEIVKTSKNLDLLKETYTNQTPRSSVLSFSAPALFSVRLYGPLTSTAYFDISIYSPLKNKDDADGIIATILNTLEINISK